MRPVPGTMSGRACAPAATLLAVLAAVTTALVPPPPAASAGLSAPNSYGVVSEDGRRVFVMRSDDAWWEARAPRSLTLPDGRTVEIGTTFPKSGCYDASTLSPLWQVDWYAFEGELLFSRDLHHIARLNRFGLKQGWALAFYTDGKLTRRYRCEDLLTALRGHNFLPYSTMDWHTRWYDYFVFDLDDRDEAFPPPAVVWPPSPLPTRGSRLHVATARRRLFLAGNEIDLGLQEFYTFDLASGSLVARRTVGRGRLLGVAGVTLAILLIAVLAPPMAGRLLWRRWRARRTARAGNGFPVVVAVPSR